MTVYTGLDAGHVRILHDPNTGRIPAEIERVGSGRGPLPAEGQVAAEVGPDPLEETNSISEVLNLEGLDVRESGSAVSEMSTDEEDELLQEQLESIGEGRHD
jgi:hypothetical protein